MEDLDHEGGGIEVDEERLIAVVSHAIGSVAERQKV